MTVLHCGQDVAHCNQAHLMPEARTSTELRNASYASSSETHKGKGTIWRVVPAVLDGHTMLSAGKPGVAGDLT